MQLLEVMLKKRTEFLSPKRGTGFSKIQNVDHVCDGLTKIKNVILMQVEEIGCHLKIVMWHFNCALLHFPKDSVTSLSKIVVLFSVKSAPCVHLQSPNEDTRQVNRLRKT